MKKTLWIGALILCLIGIALTGLLSWAHVNGTIGSICSQASGCNQVLTSSYAHFLGLPTALYGLLFYTTVLLLVLVYPLVEKIHRTLILNGLLVITGTATVVSLLLTGYSMTSLGTTCSYCIGSLVLVLLLFLGIVFWRVRGWRTGQFEGGTFTGWQIATALCLVAALGFAGLYGQSLLFADAADSEQNARARALLAADSRSLGNPAAPIHVVEFYDLACPYCQQFTAKVFPKLRSEFIDTGKVLWTFRDFPINRMHKHTLYAHSVLAMIPDHKYLEAKKKIMRNASRWTSKTSRTPVPYFNSLLQNYGLPSLQEPPQDIANRMLELRRGYARMGVNQTPTFMINGTIYKGGMPLRRWRRVFRQILSQTS